MKKFLLPPELLQSYCERRETVFTLAQKLGCSCTTARRCLQDAGFITRDRGALTRKDARWLARVKEQRAAGVSFLQIGLDMDPPVSRQAVQQRMRLLELRAQKALLVQKPPRLSRGALPPVEEHEHAV